MKREKAMFKVIVAGSRDFNDYTLLSEVLDVYLRSIHDDIQIVSGGAKGADLLGEKYAKERGHSIKRFIPDWKDLDVPGAIIKTNKYGDYNAHAGMDRNADMRDYANAAVVYRIGGSKSKGSTDMINKMKKAGKDVQTCDT